MRKFNFLLLVALVCFSVSTAFAQKKHTVEPGNTLSGIAKQYYGKGDQKNWKRIYDANQGKDLEVATVNGKDGKPVARQVPKRLVNANLIFPGQVLVIPDVAATPGAGMTDDQMKTAITGEWTGVKPAGVKDAIWKFDKDGKVYAYDAKAGAYSKTAAFDWSVAGGMLSLKGADGKSTSYKLDQTALGKGSLAFGEGDAANEWKKGGPKPKEPEGFASVKGMVTAGGAGLAGVSVKYTDKNGKAQSTTTDGSGNYTLANVAGNAQVSFSKDRYESATTSVSTTGTVASTAMKMMAPPVTKRTIAGKVTFDKGKKLDIPVPSAPVVLYIGGKETAKATTNKNGDFEFQNIPYEWDQTGEVKVEAKKEGIGSAKVPADAKDKVLTNPGTIKLKAPEKKKKK